MFGLCHSSPSAPSQRSVSLITRGSLTPPCFSLSAGAGRPAAVIGCCAAASTMSPGPNIGGGMMRRQNGGKRNGKKTVSKGGKTGRHWARGGGRRASGCRNTALVLSSLAPRGSRPRARLSMLLHRFRAQRRGRGQGRDQRTCHTNQKRRKSSQNGVNTGAREHGIRIAEFSVDHFPPLRAGSDVAVKFGLHAPLLPHPQR